MKNLNKPLFVLAGLVLSASASAGPVATASASGNSIDWQPKVSSGILLEVTNGLQFSYRKVFSNSNPSFSTTQDGKSLTDGQYTYQLTGSSSADGKGAMLRESGTFEVTNGNISLPESNDATE